MKLLTSVMVLGLCVSIADAQEFLKISVLTGHDANVSIAGGRGSDIRVRVVDGDQRPVSGATVSAVLPAIGAGGHFRGGNTVATERTDEHGEAEFQGIRLRRLTGDFTTKILARRGEGTAATTVVQTVTNTPLPPQGWRSRRRLVMLGVAGAGVAAGIMAATYGGGSSSPASAGLTVTPGSPSTTGPR